MSTQHRTRQLPPPTAPDEHQGSWVVVIVFLLGIVALIASFLIAGSGADATEPATQYVQAIIVAIAGAALMIVAAIYDRR